MDINVIPKMTTVQKTSRREKIWTIGGIVISWLTFWMFFLSPFGLVAWIGILIYLIVRKSRLKWYFILSAWLFVPGCNFVRGTVNYFDGTGHIEGIGYPERGFYSIDHETRANKTTSGCIVVGYEPFVDVPNNWAIKFLTKCFGFQHGSYTGAYPTKEEAAEIIKRGDTIAVSVIDHYYQFNIGHLKLQLDTTEFINKARRYNKTKLDTVVAATIQEACFVFQSLHPDTTASEKFETIYLMDIKGEKLFCEYNSYEYKSANNKQLEK